MERGGLLILEVRRMRESHLQVHRELDSRPQPCPPPGSGPQLLSQPACAPAPGPTPALSTFLHQKESWCE